MKAAIFDMDGTVLDSMGMWRGLAARYLHQINVDMTPEVLHALDTLGLYQSARWLIDHFSLDATEEQIRSAFDALALEGYLTAVAPKPDVKRYLLALRRRGVRLAIATLTPHALADLVLSRLEMDHLFDQILTVEDANGVRKDHPDLYLKAAALLGTSVDDCVVFEDSLYAIKTAVSAGFPTYAIADPSAQHDEAPIRALCTRYVSRWDELADELTVFA